MNSNTKQLHWTQRVALVRHNLHAASRSGDFGFFKTLQAAGFMEGTNHIATLSAELGDDVDIVVDALDNLNAGLAYVHQDAFKNVYENLKNSVREEDDQADKSKLHVDIAQQKNMADMAIDKMSSSADALIHQQPVNVQDCAAYVWITGVTIVADCMEISLKHMDDLESKLNDFIRMEESWNTVKASIVCAVTGMKGVFRLMDPQDFQKSSLRSSSIASASGAMFRRLSNAFSAPSSSRSGSVASAPGSGIVGNVPSSRASSVSCVGPIYRTPNYVRTSVSAGCPVSLPSNNDFDFRRHKLSTIPPTPAAALDEQPDPFDNSVPLVPEIPALPAMPLPSLAMEQRRTSQAVM